MKDIENFHFLHYVKRKSSNVMVNEKNLVLAEGAPLGQGHCLASPSIPTAHSSVALRDGITQSSSWPSLHLGFSAACVVLSIPRYDIPLHFVLSHERDRRSRKTRLEGGRRGVCVSCCESYVFSVASK